MKTNEGYVDRTIRVIVGLVLLSVLVIGPVPGWGLFGLLAVLPLARLTEWLADSLTRALKS